MAGIFSRFLTKPTPSVLGIDIGGSSVKVVQLKQENGVAVLETYGQLALGPYADKEVGQAVHLPAETISENIQDLMREANVTTTSVGVAIPLNKTLLTTVSLPRKEGPELQTMINLEARKYIPVPVSEVQLDWFVIPEEQGKELSPKMKVLLVAVHNEALTHLERIMNKIQVAASFYEIEIFSTIRAVVDEPVKPVMVIDIGAAATKVYIVERGLVARSHTISRGGQDVSKALSQSSSLGFAKAEQLKREEGISDTAPKPYNKDSVTLTYSNIFAEAKRVLREFETSEKRPVSGIVLTGGGGVTKNLKEYAGTFFETEVTLADPFQKTDAPAFMRPVLEEIGPEFAVAVGVALRKLEEVS
ncbi:MAG: type IV pilus assembly protein PilM [Patescibacteria group bacterium UBA2103]